MAVRRELHDLALLQQAIGKGRIVVRTQGIEQHMVGEGSLNQYLTGFIGAAGAACNLHQLRKQPFRRTEIRTEQGAVGIDDTDQREIGEVMALGQHLRAEQDIDFTGMHGFQHVVEGMLALGAVAINPQDARFRH